MVPRSVSACVRSASASAGGTGDQSASRRPSSAFCRRTRRRAVSTSATSTAPASIARRSGFAERLHRGQLDVDARVERGLGRLGPGARRAVQQLQERDREVVGDDGAVEAPRLAQQLGEQRRGLRPTARRRCRCTSSSRCARRLRGSPSRTAAAARRRARAGRSRPARGCARPATPSSRRSASASPRRPTTRALARRRCRSSRRGTGPRRWSPRPGPSARRARRRARARGPGARRPSACRRRSGGTSARRSRDRRSRPTKRNRVRGRAPRGEAREALLVRERRDAEPVRGDDALLGARRARARRPRRRPGRCRTGRVSWPSPDGSSSSRSTSSFRSCWCGATSPPSSDAPTHTP